MPVVRTFDSGSTSFLRYQRALEEWVDVLKTWYRKAGFSARFSFSILNPLPTLFVLIWSGYGLLHYGSFDFIAWVAVLLLGSGMAEAVMPMMMLNNLVAQTRLSIQRIYQVLAMPELSLPQSDQQPQEASITFEQVSFQLSASAYWRRVAGGELSCACRANCGAGRAKRRRKKHRGALAAALRRPGPKAISVLADVDRA